MNDITQQNEPEVKVVPEMTPIPSQMMDLDLIEPDPDQPRKSAADPETLEELKASIKNVRVIQPISVRKHPSKPGKFMILVGERRWCAAMALGIKAMPVLVRENLSEIEILEIQIAENMPGYRMGLKPHEKAECVAKLKRLLNLDQEGLAKHLGKSQAWVAQTLAISQISPEIVKFKEENPDLASDTTTVLALDKLQKVDPAAAERLIEKAKTEQKLQRGDATFELKKAKAIKKGAPPPAKPKERGELDAIVGKEEGDDVSLPFASHPGDTQEDAAPNAAALSEYNQVMQALPGAGMSMPSETHAASIKKERVNRKKVKKVATLLGVNEDIDLTDLLERLMDEVMNLKGVTVNEAEEAVA